MILRAFSIYDTKGGAYGSPFFFHQVGEATRAFAEVANDLATTIGRHPADFILYELGSFCTEAGLLTPMSAPIHHGHASNFVRQSAQLQLLKAAE